MGRVVWSTGPGVMETTVPPAGPACPILYCGPTGV